MPVYQYECSEGHQHMVRRPAEDRDQPVQCPRCEAGMRRRFALGGISFKGSGWARNG